MKRSWLSMVSSSSPLHRIASTSSGDSIIDEDVPDKKNLFVVFQGVERMSYFSIPVIPLLYPNDVKSPTAVETVELEFKDYRYQLSPPMTCVEWGCGLYLIGCCGLNASNNSVMRFALMPPELKDPEIKRPMNSDKGVSSIAIEHKGIIYVLSTFFSHLPEHGFESYNPKEDTWEILDSPPLDNLCIYSYVVMGNKICVSTLDAAFAYDFDIKAWEPCHLFGSPKGRKMGGLPFQFINKASVYGDCLIGMEPDRQLVMGYLIDSESGEIVKEQVLFSLEEINDEFFYFAPLFELGKGHFCIIYTRTWPHWGGNDGYDHERLVVLTFKISRSTEGSPNRFLVPPMCSSFVSVPKTTGDTFLVPQICSSHVFDVVKAADDFLLLTFAV